MMELEEMGRLAKTASRELIKLTQPQKNACLLTIAKNLVEHTDEILEANNKDIENGIANNMPESLLDRLKLTADRIDGIAEGVRQVAVLDDPVGEVIAAFQLTSTRNMKLVQLIFQLVFFSLCLRSTVLTLALLSPARNLICTPTA